MAFIWKRIQKISQISDTRINIFGRVERINKFEIFSCFRHYLHYSLRTRRRDSSSIES